MPCSRYFSWSLKQGSSDRESWSPGSYLIRIVHRQPVHYPAFHLPGVMSSMKNLSLLGYLSWIQLMPGGIVLSYRHRLSGPIQVLLHLYRIGALPVSESPSQECLLVYGTQQS